MFELLFKYPQAVFSRGTFVLAGGWPAWLLVVAILAAAAGLGFLVWRSAGCWALGRRKIGGGVVAQDASGRGVAPDVVASCAERGQFCVCNRISWP